MNNPLVSGAVIEPNNFKPLNRNVLVEVFDGRKRTKSGIELVVTSNNGFVPDRGRVISCGSKVSDVCPGDNVLLTRYEGIKLKDIDNNDYVLVSEVHIIGKIEGETDLTIYQEKIGYTEFNSGN